MRESGTKHGQKKIYGLKFESALEKTSDFDGRIEIKCFCWLQSCRLVLNIGGQSAHALVANLCHRLPLPVPAVVSEALIKRVFNGTAWRHIEAGRPQLSRG